MAEGKTTLDEKQPEKQPEKKKKAAKSAKPAPEPEGLLGGRGWLIGGAVLLVGVVGWKLLGTSYKHDVETICNAEAGSGLSIEKEPSRVEPWLRSHLGTPEGNQLYSALRDARVSDRPKKMQDAADDAHISPCPLVQSYQQALADADARSDVQHLCSEITFSKLLASDDDARLKMIEDWIDKSAKSPRTKDLGAALRQAQTGPARAKVLSDAATKNDIYSCQNVKTLENPPPAAPSGAPIVRLTSAPQINGGMKADDLKNAIDGATPAMTACYSDGLTRRPDLGGAIVLKMLIDSTGKVMKIDPAETGPKVDDRMTTACIFKVLQDLKLPASTTGLVTALLPMELAHAAEHTPAPGAPPAGAATSGAATSSAANK